MQHEFAGYAVKFKDGSFLQQLNGIRIFESYSEAKKFLDKNNIFDDFELINSNEIVCLKTLSNNQNTLKLIWSKTNEIIWQQ